MKPKKSKLYQLLAIVFAFALIAAACGDDDDDDAGSEGEGDTTAEETTDDGEEEAPAEDDDDMAEEEDDMAEEDDDMAEEEVAETAMTVAFSISPDAVWSDGTPITAADIRCTWQAAANTPTSITTTGYDIITGVDGDDKDVTINFSTVYAPFRDLFNFIIPAHVVDDCNDVSEDFRDNMPVSARAYQVESWSQDQLILTPNENYWGDDPANAARVVMVPRPENQIEALKAGEVDFIFPQGFAGLNEALDDPNIDLVPGPGTFYEGFWFQQNEGPLADDTLRSALAMTIDREVVLANIYEQIFPGAELLQCGTWVPTIGNWCDQTVFTDIFDPDGAVAMLEADGWTLNGEGLWEKDGEAPEIRWMINEPNPRRQDTQALMIPLLREAGFNIVSDNGDAATVFQQRLPALDYDMGMYISVATPDPSVTSQFHCNQVPSAENDFQGQNSQGWCNEEASELMDLSDTYVTADDLTAREDAIHQIARLMAQDTVMLPLYQFPNIAAWRTDTLEGSAPGEQAANYRSFSDNIGEWTPIGKDEIIVGAEQWPDCINPVTECANSSWMVWTATFPVLPAIFDTTGAGDYEVTDLLVDEPVVTVL